MTIDTENAVQGGKPASEAQEGVYVHPVTGHQVQQLAGFAIPAGYVYAHALDEQPEITGGEAKLAQDRASAAATDVELELRSADAREAELAARERATQLLEEENELKERELAARRAALEAGDQGDGKPGEAQAPAPRGAAAKKTNG